jgi:hypothetical protein
MDTSFCVYTDELEASSLKDALPQFLGHAERRHKDGAVVAGGERFGALPDAAYDVIAWGFDFYRYPFAVPGCLLSEALRTFLSWALVTRICGAE